MAATKQGRQHTIHDLDLANDPPGNLSPKVLDCLGQAGQLVDVVPLSGGGMSHQFSQVAAGRRPGRAFGRKGKSEGPVAGTLSAARPAVRRAGWPSGSPRGGQVDLLAENFTSGYVSPAMAADRGPDKGMALGQKYFAVGLKFAGGIILFMLAGLGLDRWLHTVPLFTIGGTLVGAALSFLSVYRELVLDRDVHGGGPGER